MPVASNFAPNSQFNRRAFAWGQGGPGGPSPAPAERPPARPAAKEPAKEEECPNRIYEVVAPTGVVRAEPHVGAKMKTKKSRGGRVICSGMTMNGWLKLENEQGWLVTNLRGIDDIGEVAVPVEGDPIQLAVPRYQPQGICCLEVVSRSGVPVRDTPSRNAKTLQTRKYGEYVFAQVQNFDGWVKLAGEEGWMLAFSPEWGKLLRRRRNVRSVDLWALCDAWAVARKRPGRSLGLNAKDVEALKELEQRMLIAAEAQFEEHVVSGNAERLVAEGLLQREDLQRPESWLRQRLFANLLAQTVQEGEEWLRDLLPNFKLSPRVPQLPIDEDDDDDDDDDEPETPTASGASYSAGGLRRGFFNGGRGAPDTHSDPTFEGTQPFEYNGKIYAMAPNGVIFDPPNQVPMGIWNQQTRRIDPAAGMVPGCPYAAISYYGKTYYLMPDEKLIDPETEAVVGVFNRETSQLELIDPGAAGVPDEVPLYDPAFNDGEPVDVHEYLERGHQMAKVGRYKAAACLYSEALKGCGQQRSVDLEFECEILRARAACWSQLGSHGELLQDAEKILTFNARDREALEWKRQAFDGLRGPRAVLSDRGLGGSMGSAGSMGSMGSKCSQCNGIASKCSKCGAGMDRCAHCDQPVGRSNCCSRCHTTYYCGRECQRAHWKIHKLQCRSGEE